MPAPIVPTLTAAMVFLLRCPALRLRALLALVGIATAACSERLPQEETLFLFPYKTRVDARLLACGYHAEERCSDDLKRRVRREVGPVDWLEQQVIGERLHGELVHSLVEDEDYTARVEAVVERMRPHLTQSHIDYRVFVFDEQEFAAFTTPGGYIYVSTGLLDLLESEDELAFIIGHELGHGENGHTAELARLIKYVETAEREGNLFEMLNAWWVQFRSTGCNKSDEVECDIAAVYLMYVAGYDPEKAFNVTRILRSLDEEKPKNTFNRKIQGLMRSHPWSEDRDRCVRDYVKNAKTVVKCQKKYPRGTQAQVATRRSPLNVRRYPNLQSPVIGQFQRGERVTLLCDCVKQLNGRQFVWARNADDLVGWVDKKYLRLNKE